MNYIVIFVTVPNVKEGKKIAFGIINRKFVACVNIVPHLNSLYWWKNRIESSKEALLIIKTKKSLFNKVVREVKRLHSYDVPEIIALPVIKGNKDYLKWIDSSTV